MDRKSIITGFVVLIITCFSCSSSQEDQRRRLSDISFTEQLKILSDGTEFETRFDRINNLAVGPKGNLFVADGSRLNFFKYSSEGEFDTSFGREGKGPGELISLSGFAVVDSSVYVWDHHLTRMNRYDLEGNFEEQILLKEITAPVQIVKAGRQKLLLYPERYRPPFDSARIAHLYPYDFKSGAISHFMAVDEINRNLEAINPLLSGAPSKSIEFIASDKFLYVPSIYGNTIFEYKLDRLGVGELAAEHTGMFTQQPFTIVEGENGRQPDAGYHSAHLDEPLEIVAHNQSRGLFKVQGYIFHFVQIDIGEKREFGAEVFTRDFDPLGFIPITSTPITTENRNSQYIWVEEADSLGNFYFSENYPDSSRVRKMHLELQELHSYM